VSAIPITSTSPGPVPTGLEEDELLPGASRHEQRLQRRLGEAAEMTAAAHRADEDLRVEEVVGQPDAVAEEGALARRARRVDEITPTERRPRARGRQRADQARLADPRAGR
jgi:hypothetical protein